MHLRKEINQLPSNYTTAYGQFQSLEKRLSSNSDLKKKYSQTIDMDLEKGYVIRLGQSEMALSQDQKEWYLPHHPVKHPHKKERVRRVCNAAAKQQGVPLNDMLMTGPDLLQKLLAVLFKFRQHKGAMTADFESMFLQVAVDKSDQSLLRFLRRADPQNAIGVFQYTRHNFCAKCSPTCEIFALQQCAKDNSDQPVVAKVFMESFYMDDLLVSCENGEELMGIKGGLSSVL